MMNISSKLTLKKHAIQMLDTQSLNKVKGGIAPTYTQGCTIMCSFIRNKCKAETIN